MKRNTSRKINEKEIKRFLLTNGTGPMQEVVERILHFFEYGAYPILIIGESGSGKEYVAKIMLSKGGNFKAFNNTKFLAVNCGAFPDEGMLLSTLFGHVKGAYTGADSYRSGYLSKASDDGIGIFLDEIHRASPRTQDTLLRYLRTGEIQKVGDDKIISIDENKRPPIVLATSKPYESIRKALIDWIDKHYPEEKLPWSKNGQNNDGEIIEESGISFDFLNRISSFTIKLPPLRSRRLDMGVIVKYLIEKYANKYEIEITHMNGLVIDFIVSYPWPGNIAELESFIQNGIIYNVHQKNKRIISYDGCLNYFNSFELFTNYIFQATYKKPVGEFIEKYLGIRRIYPTDYDGEAIPISDTSLDANNFQIEKLPRVFENAVLLSRNECAYKMGRQISGFDFDKTGEYFDLMAKYKLKKDIWPHMNFKSIYKFNEWLKKNHLDYG